MHRHPMAWETDGEIHGIVIDPLLHAPFNLRRIAWYAGDFGIPLAGGFSG